jgi:dienelactone hydrolase
MFRFLNLIGILLSLICFSASAGYLNISKREANHRLRLLDYDKNFTVEKIKKYRVKRKYEILKVKLESIHPWTKTKFNSEFFYYKSKEKGPRPLMIIIPPIVDITPLDKAMAHAFMEKGYNVFILKYNEKINDYERPLKDFNRALVSIITSARLLIDFAETKDEIDHTKIGTYGMSLGALLLSVYVGVEDRVDAAVVIVGGGHIPQIMATSQQAIAADFREARMEAEGISTNEEFQKKLEGIIKFDPMTFAHRRDRKDIYMVIGDNDSAVATKNQWMLWRAFGKPEHISYEAEHFMSILNNLTRHDLIFEFLDKRLNQGDPRPPNNGFRLNPFGS